MATTPTAQQLQYQQMILNQIKAGMTPTAFSLGIAGWTAAQAQSAYNAQNAAAQAAQTAQNVQAQAYQQALAAFNAGQTLTADQLTALGPTIAAQYQQQQAAKQAAQQQAAQQQTLATQAQASLAAGKTLTTDQANAVSALYGANVLAQYQQQIASTQNNNALAAVASNPTQANIDNYKTVAGNNGLSASAVNANLTPYQNYATALSNLQANPSLSTIAAMKAAIPAYQQASGITDTTANNLISTTQNQLQKAAVTAFQNGQTLNSDQVSLLSSAQQTQYQQQQAAQAAQQAAAQAAAQQQAQAAAQAAAQAKAQATAQFNSAAQTLQSSPSLANLNAYTQAAQAAGASVDTNLVNNAKSNISNNAYQQFAQNPTQDSLAAYQQTIQNLGLPALNANQIKQDDQTILNGMYNNVIQPAVSNQTLTQNQLDTYNSLAQQYGLTPVNTAGYQSQLTQRAALQTAESNFSLPDPSSYKTSDLLQLNPAGPGGLQGARATNNITQTDPAGNTYTLMPADPTTGAPAQWYKDTGNGSMQAVNANGQPVANAPVIPSSAFNSQLSKTQNNELTNYTNNFTAQQQSAINALPEVQAYNTAYANMQAAIAKGDPQAQTDAANALNTATTALQKSNNPLLSTNVGAGIVQTDTGQGQTAYNQYNGAEAAYQQQQAAQQQQLLQQQAQADATTKNSIATLNSDYKDLNPAQQAILGPISPTSSISDVQNTAQTAYQNALNAYQNNKSTDPTVTAQLAQNLQDAAYVNQVVAGDTQPNNTAAYVQAHSAYGTAQTQNIQAQNTLDQYQVQQAAAAQQAANQAAQNSSPLGDLFSSIGSFVDHNIPGGWATIGGAALLAVGIANPDLLGLADSGSLTPEALTSAGVDPATVSTQIATGLTDGTIAPESVGLSTAPTIGADGTITTVASDGATTTAAADGTVSTTAVDGTVAPTTASGTAATGNQVAALNANQVGALSTTGADTAGTAATTGAESGSSILSGSSINPITNVLNNVGITNPIVNGALTGAATTAGIDLVTGKPITASGLLTSAATGGIASEIGSFLPDSTGSLTQAAINGAVTSAGSNAIVDIATGKPLSVKTLAEQAAIGAAIGGAVSGFNSSTNNANGTTTYTWDDGSQMTTNSSGTPTAVSDSSGAVVNLGTVNPTTGQVTPNSGVMKPVNTVDNGDGTTTTTYGDGSTETTNNTTGSTVSVTGPVAPTPSPTVPANEIPATTATAPAGTVNNGNGTSTQTFDDGSTLTTDNNTGDVINTTNSTDTGTTGATVDSGTSSAIGATTAGTTTSTTPLPSSGFLPIPTFTGEALTNPGTNPGYIEPSPHYNPTGVAGLDQYYWGQQGTNAPAAPATGYGQASQLGQLITPQNLGYPTAQSMAAAGLQYNPQVGILQRDAYNNPVQMNTVAPVIPGVANAYGPNTPAQSASGAGGGVQLGRNLNYVAPATQLSGTPSAGLVPAGTFTAISPTDLAAQLAAQATAAGLAAAGTTSG